MKIRSGFVSNSSSSSFIVAFPKKPKTKNELSEMMFPKNPHGSVPNPWPGLEEYEEGLDNTRAVEQVFDDLQTKESKLTKTAAVDQLSGRYFVMDGKLYYEGCPYYALDTDLAKKMVELHENNETQRREFDKQEKALLEKHLGPEVPYASKTGINWKTRKPCTEEEVADYTRYCAKVKKFKENNKEAIALRVAETEAMHKYYAESRNLAIKMAKADWAAFETDNTGAFFAQFTYSDNDGQFFSLMEHAGVFDNLHHIRISHH